MDRFGKFTGNARHVLQLSQEEAQRADRAYIATEDILVALVRDERGTAARVLRRLRVDLPKAQLAVESAAPRGDGAAPGEVGLTPASKRTIELGIDEARRLGHRYIGTEHILLGLAREGEGTAASVLESLGLTLDTLRHEVIRELSDGGPETQAQ